VVPRFNERFMLSLANCRSCLLMDDELNILPTSSHAKSLKPVETDGVEVYRPRLYPQYLSLNSGQEAGLSTMSSLTHYARTSPPESGRAGTESVLCSHAEQIPLKR